MKRRLQSLLIGLVALLGVTCSPKEGETKGDALLRQAKTTGRILALAAAEGQSQVAQFEAAGEAIDPAIKQGLFDAKIATDEFNIRMAKYAKFDTESRADILKFAEGAVGFIEKMNNDGVLRIKNPKSQAIARGVISGAKVAAMLLKAQADEAPPDPGAS